MHQLVLQCSILDQTSDITIRITNTAGQLVYSQEKEDLAPGYQQLNIRHKLSSGIYIMNVIGVSDSGRKTARLRMIVTR